MWLIGPGIMIPSLNKVRRDRIFNMGVSCLLLRFRDFLTLYDILYSQQTQP